MKIKIFSIIFSFIICWCTTTTSLTLGNIFTKMTDQSVLDAIAGLRQDVKDSNSCTDDRYVDLGAQLEGGKENITAIQEQYSDIRSRIAHVEDTQGAEHSQGAVWGTKPWS